MRRLLFLIIVGGVIINFFLAPLNVFMSVICKQVLHVGAAGLGWTEASISIGALLGSLLMLSGVFKNQIRLAVFGLVLEGAALVVAGLFMNYLAVIIFAGMLGFGICFASVGISTAFQNLIDKDKMGRVMSFLSMLTSCTIPLGILTGSILVNHWQITTVFTLSGVIVGLSGLSLLIPFKDEFLKPKTVLARSRAGGE
jgi:MFS family permease